MKKFFKWALKWTAIFFLIISIPAIYMMADFYLEFKKNLPTIDLDQYQPKQTSIITAIGKDKDGKMVEHVIARLRDKEGGQYRTIVPFEDIPLDMIRAIIAAEDANFFKHSGISYTAIAIAFIRNALRDEKKGASTITMQLIKNIILTPETSYKRKGQEALLALEIEKMLDKDEILYLYLNEIYWGHGRYGAEEAARFYFGKGADELDLNEVATLAGIVQSPEKLSPKKHLEKADFRRRYVLGQMLDKGFISQKRYDSVIEKPIVTKDFKKTYPHLGKAKLFVTEVKKEMTERHGKGWENKGWIIKTTLNLDAQEAAEKAAEKGIKDYAKRQKLGKNETLPQVCIIVQNPHTKEVIAMYGGTTKLNHCTQIDRPTGSTIKPFIYGTGIVKGIIKTSTIMMDQPEVFRLPNQPNWNPQNSDGKYLLEIPLRMALAKSRNPVAVHILDRAGLKPTQKFIRKVGIEATLTDNLTMALGSSEMSPETLATGYATLASGGKKRKKRKKSNIKILLVLDQTGETLFEEYFDEEQAITPAEAYIITDLLTSVVQDGTAKKAKKLKRPVAGKTGTTNGYRDGWFAGYTSDFLTVVWVGYDNNTTLGEKEYGGKVALPIWLSTMEFLHDYLPIKEFEKPEGIVELMIDTKTGDLAVEYSPGSKKEIFLKGKTPRHYAPDRTERKILKNGVETIIKEKSKDEFLMGGF